MDRIPNTSIIERIKSMENLTPVTILIPAYNEEPRIADVLDVVCEYKRPKRIIVIDDGSEDNTYQEAQKYPVEVLRHEENRGKGAALQTGIDHGGKSPLWLFLDADLINLNENHMETLLTPLEQDKSLGMTVGMFVSGGKTNVDLAQRYFSILNGQRGLAGFFIESLPSLNWARFGVEIFLSRLAKKNGVPTAEPLLANITHHTKEEKYGFRRGFVYRLQMYKECLYSYFNWQKYC